MHSLLRRIEVLVLVLLCVVCGGIWTAVYAAEEKISNVLTVAMLDVGQGDALYIESPTGVQVLVDAGPDSSVLSALADIMPALDYSLDAVVATHWDADHIGGFDDVLSRYSVGAYIYPGLKKYTAISRALEKVVGEKEIPRVLARRGMVLELGGGAQLRVLYPESDVSYLPSDKTNEGGIVLELVYGESEMLLMADVGFGVENRLRSLDTEELNSEVLKVGHHGSRFSTSETFLAAVSPDTALISVSKNNTYGHPTAQTLSRLKNAGAEILRTDQEGTIVLRSRGETFERVR
jgi:beta-lactamase superfamily II metal-dependent hydrolase